MPRCDEILEIANGPPGYFRDMADLGVPTRRRSRGRHSQPVSNLRDNAAADTERLNRPGRSVFREDYVDAIVVEDEGDEFLDGHDGVSDGGFSPSGASAL